MNYATVPQIFEYSHQLQDNQIFVESDKKTLGESFNKILNIIYSIYTIKWCIR